MTWTDPVKELTRGGGEENAKPRTRDMLFPTHQIMGTVAPGT